MTARTVGVVVRCAGCGALVTWEGTPVGALCPGGSWVDATGGDGCGAGVHSPATVEDARRVRVVRTAGPASGGRWAVEIEGAVVEGGFFARAAAERAADVWRAPAVCRNSRACAAAGCDDCERSYGPARGGRS